MTLTSVLAAAIFVAVVAAQDDESGAFGGDGDLMYRRRINNTCTTLQMVPGRNTAYEYTAETGDPAFLSYTTCQEKCTELGLSCLGFEFSVRTTTVVPSSPNQGGGDSVGPTEEQEVRCKFWNRLPVDFTALNLADGRIGEASCVVKEFVAFKDSGTCDVGFIPDSSLNSTYETLTDVSAVDCYDECMKRSTDTGFLPTFGVDNTTGKCYGVRYDNTNSECQLWNTSTFSVQDGNGTSAEDTVASGGDDTEDLADEDICYVRSFTVLNDPLKYVKNGCVYLSMHCFTKNHIAISHLLPSLANLSKLVNQERDRSEIRTVRSILRSPHPLSAKHHQRNCTFSILLFPERNRVMDVTASPNRQGIVISGSVCSMLNLSVLVSRLKRSSRR